MPIQRCMIPLAGGLLMLLMATRVLVAAAATNAIPMEVGVDPRVELISIVFHLAGNPEYCSGAEWDYVKDVNRYFEPFRNHSLIKLAQKLRSTRGVSFDAPMSLAIHLNDTTELKERISFQPPPDGLDGRWQVDELMEFLKLTRQFMKESDFNGFFRTHQPLYNLTATRAKESFTAAHLEWFEQFFGARPGAEFKVVIALINGPNNYGARIRASGKEELYCILGVYRWDFWGRPIFDRSMLETVAHEFCHSYVNPLVYARVADLEPAGIKLFGKVEDRMKRQAYGNWATMMHESVVRAAVVRYLHTTQGDKAADRRIQYEINYGFLWMDDLTQLLAQYESQRDRYPTFDAFFPQVIDFFNSYGKQVKPHAWRNTINGMREFIIDNAKHVMCILLLIARLADIVSTYLATPTLQLESNPLAKRLGWPFIVMSVFACAIPYWSVSIGMVVLVVSLWVSADNIGRLWFIRALGETEYRAMVRRAENRGSLLGRFIVSFSQAVCITAMGIILCFLTYASPQLPLSFWFGVGILAYAFQNLSIGSLRFYKMVNQNRTIIAEQPTGGDGVNAAPQP